MEGRHGNLRTRFTATVDRIPPRPGAVLGRAEYEAVSGAPSVLHVLWSARFGGIERLAIDLAEHQQMRGRRVALLFGQRDGEFLPDLKNRNLAHEFLNLRNGYDVSPLKARRASRLMAQFDVIHLHSFHPLTAACALPSRSKVVFTFHGNSAARRSLRLSDPPKRFFLNQFLRLGVDHITYNSSFTRMLSDQIYGAYPEKSSVVYNGVTLSELEKPPLGVDETVRERLRGKFVVGTSSRFVGFKRIDRLVRAFAQFRKGREAVLLLVGDGVLRGALEALVKEQGIEDATVFAGFRRNVHEYQDLMDVCVFPSENEPFGLVAVEALGLGKPAVVFQDSGGMREVVAGFSEADVVQNVRALSDRLFHYYANRAEIESGAERRRQYAQSFDMGVMADEFAQIYEEVVSARP